MEYAWGNNGVTR